MQWITTRKLPIPEKLPAQYGTVTSNTSESINPMIVKLQFEGWMELPQEILCYMTLRISDKKQEYISK